MCILYDEERGNKGTQNAQNSDYVFFTKKNENYNFFFLSLSLSLSLSLYFALNLTKIQMKSQQFAFGSKYFAEFFLNQ